MTTSSTFAIVGGGLAGAKAAEALRDKDFDGHIVLFAAEERLPYERPPLSKDYLAGNKAFGDFVDTLPDDEVKARLTSLRGLGEWSADWFLARYLGRPHAWPAGDLGLRKAVLAFYPETDDVRAAAARFHPFENLSAHYLLLALRYA